MDELYSFPNHPFGVRDDDISKNAAVFGNIVRVGLVPFGLNMSPILSLILINRFSMAYGGETAVAY